MASIRTNNKPAMLKWAREQVGYTLEQAASTIGVSVELLAAAESEEDDHQLTLAQLRKAADAYDTPFGYFYLSEAPHQDEYSPVPDFRIDPDLAGVDHPRLHLEIKKVRTRREVFIDLLNDLGQETPAFARIVGRTVVQTAKLARDRLGVTQTLIRGLTFGTSYAFWKERIEDDGVLVYESQYIPKSSGVIGAALSYEALPIILIARGGARNVRRLFTLLHEYAHLLIGESALNDSLAQVVRLQNSDQSRVESFCNQVAAEILVPSSEVRAEDYSGQNPVEMMEMLARRFNVTYTTAAVCLYRLEIIERDTLRRLLGLREEAHKQKKKSKNADADLRIPRETIMRLDLGRPMFDAVLTAYGDGVLDVYDASKILNLRVKKIDKLLAGSQ